MKDSAHPRISVVIAVRNRRGTLARCLESVPQSWELLVVDGASTDGSVQVIEQHAPRIAWWRSEPDRGVYSAWNKALRHVRGAWVLFLGADDWLESGVQILDDALGHVSKDIAVAYGRVRLVSPGGREIAVVGQPWSLCGPRLRRGMALPHQGVFHRRKLFEDRRCFDESFAIAGDYEFLLRELTRRPAHFLVRGPVVANMSVGGLSMQGCRLLQHVREIRRAQEMHGVFKNGIRYRAMWTRAVMRACAERWLGGERAARMADAVRRAAGQPEVWSVR